VTTLKPNVEREVLLAFLQEIKIVSYIEDYPHLVHFFGANTINITKGKYQYDGYKILNICRTNFTFDTPSYVFNVGEVEFWGIFSLG